MAAGLQTIAVAAMWTFVGSVKVLGREWRLNASSGLASRRVADQEKSALTSCQRYPRLEYWSQCVSS